MPGQAFRANLTALNAVSEENWIIFLYRSAFALITSHIIFVASKELELPKLHENMKVDPFAHCFSVFKFVLYLKLCFERLVVKLYAYFMSNLMSMCSGVNLPHRNWNRNANCTRQINVIDELHFNVVHCKMEALYLMEYQGKVSNKGCP